VRAEAQAEAAAQEEALHELREAKRHAERDFEMVIEQTENDLDEDDETMTLQFDKLQREQVDGLRAQLNVATRCAPMSQRRACGCGCARRQTVATLANDSDTMQKRH
jgi:hypothetical protein